MPLRNFNLHNASARLLLVFSILTIAAVACSGSSRGEGGDFEIGTYQSGGVLDGRETTFQAVLDQGKPVVLNFWGGDCPPCRAEMPTLQSAWEEYDEEVVMLGIDIGRFMGLGTTEQGLQLLQDTGVTYPAGNTPNSSVLEDFNLNALPATFFMLPDGTIMDSFPGAIRSFTLSNSIDNLIEAHNG